MQKSSIAIRRQNQSLKRLIMDNNEASRKKFEESYISILEPSNERVKTEIISKFSDGEYKNIMTNVSWKLWQAAQQQSAGEIANLMLNIEAQEKLGYELQADNERLREALKKTQDNLSHLIYHGMEQWAKDEANNAYELIEQALSATTSQSLQAHNEVKGK